MNKRRQKRRAAPPKVAVRWLRTPAAAAYAGLSRSTLEKLRWLDRGPVYARLGRVAVYDIAELDRWIEARRCTSISAPSLPMTGQGSKAQHRQRAERRDARLAVRSTPP
jgi:predicted DNA-binding transcriptional regulator AlpA